MNLESTVGLARPNTKSLRATIPEGIVAFLELTERDKLEWKMDIQVGRRVVIVTKVTDSNIPKPATRTSKRK